MLLEAIGAMVLFALSSVFLKLVTRTNLENVLTTPTIYYAIAMIITGLTGFVLSYFAMKNGKTAIVAAIAGSAPAMILILSTIFLNESYNLKEVAGILIIIIGLILFVI